MRRLGSSLAAAWCKKTYQGAGVTATTNENLNWEENEAKESGQKLE